MAAPALRRTTVVTPTLAVACEERGPEDGEAVVLLHGFPYDPRCFDRIAPRLAAEGHRVIAPYLRGFGATRFLGAGTPRRRRISSTSSTPCPSRAPP